MKKNPYAPPDPNAPLPPPQEPRPEPSREDPPKGPSGPKGEPPSMEELKAASKISFTFGSLLILALLSTQLPLPYAVVAPLFIVGALVYGVRALRRSWAISPRNMMTPMLAMGIVMALLMSVTVMTKFALWPIEMERQECMHYAITNSAKAECAADYQQAVDDRLSSLRGGLTGN